MAAAMLPRLVAVAALVALMCAVAVAQNVPAKDGAPTCGVADQYVVNACYKTFAEGRQIAEGLKDGRPPRVNCCSSFKGFSCLCLMKNALVAQGKTAHMNVECLRNPAC